MNRLGKIGDKWDSLLKFVIDKEIRESPSNIIVAAYVDQGQINCGRMNVENCKNPELTGRCIL